jgi:hypothetical protein
MLEAARLRMAAAPVNTHPTTYRSIDVDGLSIFYREAGSPGAPTFLLLHGFPSSSRMYEPLFIRLADAFHLVAPDYPAFGHSDAPVPAAFDYTFDHIARDHRPLHGADAHRSVQPLHAGLRRGLSGSAWRWRTPTGSQRWWSRTRWLTRTAWGHFGKPAVLSGLTAPATKPLSGRTRPSMPPVSGTWGLAPTCPCTTRTSGPTSSRS